MVFNGSTINKCTPSDMMTVNKSIPTDSFQKALKNYIFHNVVRSQATKYQTENANQAGSHQTFYSTTVQIRDRRNTDVKLQK